MRRDLQRELLVGRIEALGDDPADVGDILIAILDGATERDRSVEFQSDQRPARNDAHTVSERGGRFRCPRRGLEDRVRLARYQICDRLRMLRIGSCRVHPQHIGAMSDDVAARAQRLGQGSELAARHEQIDGDRGAQATVVADRDPADQRVIGSDLGEDHRQLRKGTRALVQGLERVVGDAERADGPG